MFAGSVQIETFVPDPTNADTMVGLFKSGALKVAMLPFNVLNVFKRDDLNFAYEWSAGEWSACSVSCGKFLFATGHCTDLRTRGFAGVGVQTRSVKCLRSTSITSANTTSIITKAEVESTSCGRVRTMKPDRLPLYALHSIGA
jgi:hypothetical protein